MCGPHCCATADACVYITFGLAAGLFSPGNPTSFQSNYLAGQQLLCELEGLATSRAAVERLRASSAAAGWAKRWNLPVYFSLVYQDTAGRQACVVTWSSAAFV